MIWFLLAVLAIAGTMMAVKIAKAEPAYADLKCGDAPMYFGGGDGLVVTWVGPTKESAKVRLGDGEIFRRIAEVTGSDIPEGYPEKYLRDLQEAEVFNASMAWSTDELTQWEGRHGIDMEPEALGVFQRYLDTKHPIFMSLVSHPEVRDPGAFIACSLVLQRAVMIYDEGREDLFLRSYFYSAKDENEFVNFVPRTGVHFSFPTDSIWFPLELTRLIREPASYVELDVLSRSSLDENALPAPFTRARSGSSGTLLLGGKKFNVTRISGVLDVSEGRAIEDFNVPVANLGVK